MSVEYPRGCNSARVISVIETQSARGSGEPESPVRIVKEYWTLDGKKLAECDPHDFETERASSNVSSDSM